MGCQSPTHGDLERVEKEFREGYLYRWLGKGEGLPFAGTGLTGLLEGLTPFAFGKTNRGHVVMSGSGRGS